MNLRNICPGIFANLTFKSTLLWLVCIACSPLMNSASAVTAEVAKKCNALLDQAFPPLAIGNPAAGRKGTAKAREDFHRQCIEKDGKMPAK
jgi:hypothetical protein